MKLRNKKTGEIWGIPKMRHPTVQEDDISFFAMLGTNGELFSYHSLAELNEEFEDYEPKEPLIKDEKIRKAVRAWAEANDFTRIYYDEYHNAFRNINDVGFTTISFLRDVDEQILPLEDGKTYTIAELCGEEEE